MSTSLVRLTGDELKLRISLLPDAAQNDYEHWQPLLAPIVAMKGGGIIRAVKELAFLEDDLQ